MEWHFVSHIECDGIGGFAKLLRERGVITGKLPETKHPCRGVIVPLWNLWLDSHKGVNQVARAAWLQPASESSISEAVAWHLFTVDETLEIVARCREMNVTVNSFFLKQLDHVIRSAIAKPKDRISWMVPVNLRGDIHVGEDTANHVSCVEVSIAPEDRAELIHADILSRLKRGEHRANHLLLMSGALLSHAAKVKYLKNDRAKPNGNIGSFSNLGVWNGKESSGDGWVFCPPVVAGQLLGAGCVTFQGRLGIAMQSHSSTPMVMEGLMARYIDLIRHLAR
jgi:NRPS condensation-like uncharacterized protein